MREKKAFAERKRTRASDEVLRKYFLVFEGTETEVIYFDALESKRGELGIDPLIDLRPIERNFHERGWSHPKKILDKLLKDIEESVSEQISYESTIERIIEYLLSEQLLKEGGNGAKILRSKAHLEYKDKLEQKVDDFEEVCVFFINMLNEKSEVKVDIGDIINSIKMQDIVYDENFDKVCLIIDRDRKSFIVNDRINQYQDVLDKCGEKGFQLYVSNPCFEFWLLLHFDEVKSLAHEKLLANEKVSTRRNYIEEELKKIFQGYKKNSYNAEKLLNNIEKAMENSKGFCVSLLELENELGSNICQLISELRGEM